MSDALVAGDTAPAFTLPDSTGRPVSLSDLTGHRVVLYFFPKAFTSGCTTQACDIRDNWPQLVATGAVLFGISRDAPDVLAEFARANRLPFRLLSDVDRVAHAAYGVLGSADVDGVKKEKVMRSTFVISADGMIESAHYGVEVPEHVSTLLAGLPT